MSSSYRRSALSIAAKRVGADALGLAGAKGNIGNPKLNRSYRARAAEKFQRQGHSYCPLGSSFARSVGKILAR